MKIMHIFNMRQSPIKAKTSAIKESIASPAPVRERSAGGLSTGYVRESDLLSEDVFREVLFFERKRAERTLRPAQLMLLDVSAISGKEDRCAVIRHSIQALADSNGDVSLKGWYSRGAVLGVILTGADEAAKDALRERIYGKIPPALLDRAAGHFKVFFCSFPHPVEQHNGNEDTDRFFYPDTKNEKKRRLSMHLKRAMDILGGLAGLILFSPFFIILPLIIKAMSKGPVLFKQERIGRHGKKFVFLKFRTMSAGSDPKIHQDYIKKLIREKKSYDSGPQSGSVYKIKDDPRITPVGRLLRKTSLDELPQFLNVIRGDMSLVGPRPPIPYELEIYDLWHRRRVMEIKPGITGLWQVKGRSSTSFDEMVRLDLKYAKEWSLWLDIKILLKTPHVVLTGKGGY